MNKKTLTGGFGIGNILFVAALVIALPLRIYQYLGGVVEPATGFFAKNNFSVYALYGVIALFAVAAVVLGIINRKKLFYEIDSQKNIFLGVASVLVALGIIFDAAFCLDIPGTINAIRSATPEQPSTEITTNYVIVAQAAVSLLAALFFTVLGFVAFMGRTFASELRLLSLTPVLWAMLRMVARFMRTISYTRVSELLFEMFMLAFMIMFFMNFAQCNSKVNDEGNAWKLASYGLPAALLGLLCFVPRAIMLAAGKGDVIYSGSALEFSDLTVALFAIATILTKVTDRPPVKVAVTESAEKTTAENTEEKSEE